ncbi:MAG: hypothetical protein Q9161_001769 [Pseudevernia consocians]
MHSDSNASFNSLFDEPESESDHLFTRKAGDKSLQTKHVSSTAVVDTKRTAETMGKRSTERSPFFLPAQPVPVGKKQRFTLPSPSTIKPATPQRNPISPAPLAKMVATHRDLPKLSVSQSVAIPANQRQTQGNSSITAWNISSESATSGQAWEKSPSISTTARGKGPSISTALAPTSASSDQFKLEKTTLKVYMHGNKGYRPLLLKDCMAASLFFAKIMEIWSLPDDSDKRLHVIFPWLPKENNGRLMILDRQSIKAGMVCIRDEVDIAPCWIEGKGRCSIDVTVFEHANREGQIR